MKISLPLQKFEPKYFQMQKIYKGKKALYRNPQMESRYNKAQHYNQTNISRVINGLSLRLEITRVPEAQGFYYSRLNDFRLRNCLKKKVISYSIQYFPTADYYLAVNESIMDN